jgi:hypothetical protein
MSIIGFLKSLFRRPVKNRRPSASDFRIPPGWSEYRPGQGSIWDQSEMVRGPNGWQRKIKRGH